MRFHDTQEKSELAELRQKIEDMEAQKREDQMAQLDRKFEDLQRQVRRIRRPKTSMGRAGLIR